MKRRGEFDLIDGLFATLACNSPAALELKDDAALLKPAPGREIVATTDALVAEVHFRVDDPPDLIGRKLLRVSVSDLASMGAEPLAYLLTVVLPPEVEDEWLERFVAGLAQDQEEFGLKLAGGDTVSTGGPLVFSLTALGDVPAGEALRRSGAWAGEDIWVSGTIGDGALGLKVTQPGFPSLSESGRAALRDRYLLPRPRVGLGVGLRGVAKSCIDVSDGLVADLGHVCRASGVGGEVFFDQVPLSEPARTALAANPGLIETVLGGGDDYELLFTASPELRDDVHGIARSCGVDATLIGQIQAGEGVVIRGPENAEIIVTSAGYTHF